MNAPNVAPLGYFIRNLDTGRALTGHAAYFGVPSSPGPNYEVVPVYEHPATDDWRDDPSADERWNAGVDYAQQRLCKVLGVNPDDVTWDAATEELDGDIEAVIANILTKAMGERWRPKTTGTQRGHAAAFEAVREEHARRCVLSLLKEIDTNCTSKSVVVAQLRSAALVPAGESGMELLDRMANVGLVDVTGMTVELTEEGFRVAESVRRP